MSQTTEYYTIDEAIQNKENAISVFLNYNFQEVKPITDLISELTNLEEFRIFPRWFDFPKIENKKVISEKLDESKSKTPDAIPTGITNCQNLKLIDISNSEIKSLPINFELLTNLEVLVLNYSNVNLSTELEKIVALKNLKEIQLVGIEMNNEQRLELKTVPNLKILTLSEDFEDQMNEDDTVDVQIHDTYIVFPNEEEANRFINSMPNGMGNNVKKYKKAIANNR